MWCGADLNGDNLWIGDHCRFGVRVRVADLRNNTADQPLFSFFVVYKLLEKVTKSIM